MSVDARPVPDRARSIGPREGSFIRKSFALLKQIVARALCRSFVIADVFSLMEGLARDGVFWERRVCSKPLRKREGKE